MAVISAGSSVHSLGGVVALLATALALLLRSDAFGIAVAYAASKGFNTSSGALAIGVGIALNRVKNTTAASIVGSTVAADGDARVKAEDSGNVSALGIGVAVSVARGSGATGALAGAGSAAVNDVDGTITSKISDSGGSKHVTSSTGSVALTATDSVDVVGIAGTVAFALGLKSQGTGSTAAVAAGVAVVLNDIGLDSSGRRTTSATIDNSVVTAHNDVTLTALSDSTIFALAVGGAAAAAGASGVGGGTTGAFAGAGVGTENTIKQMIEAAITGNSVVTATAGMAILHATDESEIHADAGGVAIAIAVGKNGGNAVSGSVGLAIALNTITSDVLAYVDHSTVTAEGVELNAKSARAPPSTSDYRIDALALSVAGSGSGTSGKGGLSGAFAGAGSGARNQLDGSIHAYVKDSNGLQGVTATAGEVTINASDDSSIRSDTGGFAIALSASLGKGTAAAASIGISVSLNEIGLGGGRSVIAEIVNSKVTAAGIVEVKALSTATIDALAIAGTASGAGSSSGLGGALAGAGVGASNKIKTDIHASVKGGSTVTANGRTGVAGNVTVSATDQSVIDAKAIGIAIAVGVSTGGNAGAIAVGISIGINTIENDVLAELDASSVTANANGNVTLHAYEDAAIHALSVAASLSVAAASDKALSIAGGGAVSLNSILSRANVAIAGSTITAAQLLTLDSRSQSTIDATVVAAALGIGAGSSGGAAAAIGVAVARNFVGYDEFGNVPNDSNSKPKTSQIRAYIENSTISSGALSATATAAQSISAVVVSVSVAIAASGKSGFGLGGSGVFTENVIKSEIRASITGAGAGGVKPTSISLEAKDTSTITASAGAAAVAVAVASSNAVSVTIGIALAHNRIDNTIEASITDVPLDIGGDVTVKATENATITAISVAASLSVGAGLGGAGVAIGGAGAESTNVLLTRTNAFVKGSNVTKAGNLDIEASMTGAIIATVVAASLAVGGGSSTGVGVAIGISVGRNFIGWDPVGTDVTPTYGTDHAPVASLDKGDKVRVKSGPLAGDVYEYIGPKITDGDPFTSGDQPIDLTIQNYADTSLWEHVSAKDSPAEVQAFVQDSPLTITGDVSIKATSDATIRAVVVAVAGAVSGGGTTGVGVSGAGDYTENKIATLVQAYVASSSSQSVEAKSFKITATDSSRIQAVGVGASLAAAFGIGAVGVSISVGITIAFNEVNNDVSAFAKGVVLTTTSGNVLIEATTQGGTLFNLTEPVSMTDKFDDTAATEMARKLDDASATDTSDASDVTDDNDTLQALEGNFSGNGHPLTAGKYSTSQVLPPVFTTLLGKRDLVTGDTVLVEPGYTHGGVAGTVYVFYAAKELGVDLGIEDYTDTNRWKVGLWVPLKNGDVVRDSSTGLSYRYEGADATNLIDLGAQTYATDAANWQYEPPALTKIKQGEIWQLTSGTDTYLITRVVDEDDDTTTFVVSRPTIDSVAVAASFAVSYGSTAGVAVAGAGAFARNSILGKTKAYILDSSVTSAADVLLHAKSTNSIAATIVAASLAVGASAGAGVGASIGVGISENSIGKLDSDGTRHPVEVLAYVKTSAVQAATGNLEQTATADQTISALVVAASAAVGGGGVAGVAASGAGSSATNTIVVDVKATIDGEGDQSFEIKGVSAKTVSLTATDTSKIKALALGASLAAGFGGAGGGALSIGVSLALNEIVDEIEASISKVASGVTGTAGDVRLTAESTASIESLAVAASLAASGGSIAAVAISGAGADATNVILTRTNAFVIDSTVTTTGTGAQAGDIALKAKSSSTIRAVVAAAAVAVSGGWGAAAGAIGVSLSRNLIGWTRDLDESASEIQAYVKSSTIDATGDFKLCATADQTIEALVLGFAVAVAGGAFTFGATGVGSSADNRITTHVKAFLEGDPLAATGMTVDANSVTLMATDTSRIHASVGAASVSVAAGVGAAIAVSIAVAIARNRVANEVAAYASNLARLKSRVGSIKVEASTGADPLFNVTDASIAGKLDELVKTHPDGELASPSDVQTLMPSLDLSDTLVVTNLVEGAEWVLRDVGNDRAYVIRKNTQGTFDVYAVTIDAISIAASASVAIGGALGGGAGSGAGALATNIILSKTNAYIASTDDVDSAADLTITATSTSAIVATIVSASIAVGGGGLGGAALSIGVAIARNLIGYDDGDGSDPSYKVSEKPASVAKGATVEVDEGPLTGRIYENVGPTLTFSWTYTQSQTPAKINTGERVKLDNDKVFQYVGKDPLSNPNFSTEDYTDGSKWQQQTSAVSDQDFTNTAQWLPIRTLEQVQVRAYVQSSDVTKAGALILHATSHQTIAAIVVAGSASVAGAGVAGVGASGAGAAAENRISVAVAAFIAGDAGSGITAKTISLTAEDTSTIKSDVGAGAIGAGFGGIAGVGVAIAVALATNEIANDVTASISSATVTASAGGISVLAREGATIRALSVSATIAAGGGGIAGVAVAGAGASALNAITNRVLAYGDGGSLKTTSSATTPETPGDVTFEAHDVSLISATIAAVSLAVGGGGVAGVGVSIGVSIAQNRIGPFYNLTSDQFVDPDDGSDPGVTLANGALVRVALTHAHGGDPGAIYKYTGGLSSRTLSTEDYSTGPWEKVTDAAPDDILAYLHDTSVDADGTLTLEATADETITAVTAAGAAAVAGGGIAAVAASGAGSSATNVMTARVMAYIDGDGDGVTADAVGISATDTSTVTALTIAGAFAASVAPTGAAIAIGVSLSTNIVANDVQAYIANADDHVTTSGAVSLSAVSQSAPVLDSNDDPFVLDGVTVDQLDAGDIGTVSTIRTKFPASAPLGDDDLQLFTVDAGHAWELIASRGTAYLIRLDTSTDPAKLLVSHATITALTISAAASFGAIAGTVAAAGANAQNVYSSRTRASVGDGSTINPGSLSVTASDTSSVASFLVGTAAAVSVVSLGDASSVTGNIINSLVEAAIGAATVTAAADVTLSATSRLIVYAATFAVAIGGGANTDSMARTFIGGHTTASIGRATVTATTGHVDLSAASTLNANSIMRDGSGGALAVTTSDGKTTLAHDTKASIAEGAVVDVQSLRVHAETTATGISRLDSGAGGAIAVNAGHATTVVKGTVQASIGPDGAATLPSDQRTTITAEDDIEISTLSSTFAKANGGGGSGGVISVGELFVTATDSAATKAFIGDAVSVPGARNITISAEIEGAPASATGVYSSGAVIDIKGAHATATSQPKAEAYIGDAVTIGDLANAAAPVAIGGNVMVTAIGRAEADATGNAFGGGVVTVGSPDATATLAPSVDAHIGTDGAARSTVVVAKGSIKVRAELTRAGAAVPVDTIDAVDVTGEKLDFTYAGIGEGASVRYSGGTNTCTDPGSLNPDPSWTEICGLHSGTVYTVLDAGQDNIRLGSLFRLTSVDPLQETITFAGTQPFQSGDCVYYDPHTGPSIIASWQTAHANLAPCTNTTGDATLQVYYVRVLDAANPNSPHNVIKLMATKEAALAADDAPFDVTVGNSATTHLKLTSGIPTGLTVDTAVIYRAPVAFGFTNASVDIELTSATDANGNTVKVPLSGPCPGSPLYALLPDHCGVIFHNDGGNNLFVGTDVASKLVSGQAVRYVNRSGQPIGLQTGGTLISGGTYYVIKRSDGVIQLADTYCRAVGTDGDSTLCPAAVGPDGDPGTADDIKQQVTPLQLKILIATGTDGHVTHDSTQFTAASANFQSSDVNKLLRFGVAVYRIVARTSATSVTLDRKYSGSDSTAASWALYSDLDQHSLEGSIDGLADGQTYYVKSVSSSDDTIELKATHGGIDAITLNGLHRPGTHGIGFVEVDLDLPSATLAAAAAAGATTIKVNSTAGLVAGHTIVVDVGGNREARTIKTVGTAGAGGTGVELTAALSQPHLLGAVVMDAAPGSEALFANLSSTGSGPQRLLAPSGESLSSVSPPPGDGQSVASSQGGDGGVGDFSFPNAHLKGSPVVTATLAASKIDAGADIVLQAISSFDTLANADTAGGGVITVAKATAFIDLGETPTTATVASSTELTAGGDVTILASNDHKLVSIARSVGGGLFSGKIAFTSAKVTNDVNVEIEENASIVAGGAIAIGVDSQTTMSTHSETYSVALGAGADSDNTNKDDQGNDTLRGVRLGKSDDHAQRGVTVEAGAQIKGLTVGLVAQVSRLNVKVEAFATAYSPILIGVASAFSDAYLDAFSDTFVHVVGGTPKTTITGLRGVDIEARHTGDITITRHAQDLAVAIIFPQEGHTRGTDALSNLTLLDKSALVVAGPRSAVPATAVTIDTSTNELTATGHGFKNGDRVTVYAADAPLATAPFAIDTWAPYYVLNATADTFQLASTPGGAAIDFTAGGSSVTIVPYGAVRPTLPGLQLALYAAAHMGFIFFSGLIEGIHYENDTQDWTSQIRWDADVVILGGMDGNPLLVVGADGTVEAVNAVKLVDDAHPDDRSYDYTPSVGDSVDPDGDLSYTIASIGNTGYGDILFVADANAHFVGDSVTNTADNSHNIANDQAAGTTDHPWPIFDMRDNLASVTIVDYSGLKMKVGKIDVINDLAGGDATVELVPGGAAPIQFDLHSSVSPSLVAIEKFGLGGIVLTGDINNPVGLTLITDASTGDVSAAAGVIPRITTNILDIQTSAGSIGSSSGRIEVDLIQFIEKKRVDGPTVDGFRTSTLLAQAGGATSDIYLSLRGLDRVPSSVASTFTISSGLTRVDNRTFTATGDRRDAIGFGFGVDLNVNGTTAHSTVADVGYDPVANKTTVTLADPVVTNANLLGATFTRPAGEIDVPIDLVDAGRDDDLILRTGLRQAGLATDAGVIVIVENETGTFAPPDGHRVLVHFRPDIGTTKHDAAAYPAQAATLAAATAIGATNIKVSSVADFVAGQTILLDTGNDEESAVILTVGTAGESGTGITLTAALKKAHASATPVEATAVNSLYTFALRNELLPRTLETLGDTRLQGYRITTLQGDFVTGGDATAPEMPGLLAGRHIRVKDVEGFLDSSGLAADSHSPTKISIEGFTDLADTGTGWIDVNVNGHVTLKEVSGDMRVGLIRSRGSNVTLTAAVSILDSNPADADPATLRRRARPIRRTCRATTSLSPRSPARSARRATSSRRTSTTTSPRPAISTPTPSWARTSTRCSTTCASAS